MESAFLVGCSRSGTTLLQSMIASHSKVISFPETHFFSGTMSINPVLRRLKLYGKNDRAKVQDFLNTHEYGLSPFQEVPKNYSHQTWCRKLVEILHEMAAHDADKASASPAYWIEKTPRHLHYISSIEKAASRQKFLHILREGKDVVASLHLATKQNPGEWGGERSLKKCINWWKRDIKESLRYKDSPNHFFVVYQQLVDEPEKVLSQTCDFLSIEYEPAMATKFHQKAPALTAKEECWKGRNTSKKLKMSKKLQDNFSGSSIKYIIDKTASVDLSPFYL